MFLRYEPLLKFRLSFKSTIEVDSELDFAPSPPTTQTEKSWRCFHSSLIHKPGCLADPEVWAHAQFTVGSTNLKHTGRHNRFGG